MATERNDDTAAVWAALARIRGRRGPRGLHGEHGHDHRGRGGGWGREHLHADQPHGGERPDPFGGPGGGRLGGPARFRLLEVLAAASGPLSISDLADAVGVDQPRASRLVQQVVEQGLAAREPDPDDARRTRVALTPEGAKLAQGVRGHRHDMITTALDGLDADERAEFIRLLTKFAASWPDA